jgi:hypothetical protein
MCFNFEPNAKPVFRLPDLHHVGAGITWDHIVRFLLLSGVVAPLAGAPQGVKNGIVLSVKKILPRKMPGLIAIFGVQRPHAANAFAPEMCLYCNATYCAKRIKLWIAEILALRRRVRSLSGQICLT